MLEVEEQAVVAGGRAVVREPDVRPGCGGAVAGLAGGVDVQVGEVAVAQRDQVAVGAEVGLQVGDRPAVPAHRQGELDSAPGSRSPVRVDGVAVDLGGPGSAGSGAGANSPGTARSAPSVRFSPSAGRREVGEQAPGARRRAPAGRARRRPRPGRGGRAGSRSGRGGPRSGAALPSWLDVEGGDGGAVRAEDPEGDRGSRAGVPALTTSLRRIAPGSSECRRRR